MGQKSTHHIMRFSSCQFLFGIIAAFVLLPLLAQAQPITANITSTNVTCYGFCNGTATASASGGWAPYTYQWSTGATTATITGLCPGSYTVTVTDIDLGFSVVSTTISQPPQLGASIDTHHQQLCSVAPDGIASVTPFGGTPPYTYLWSTGAVTPQVTGLAVGTYYVTVTDANSCTAVATTTIILQPEGLWVIDVTTNVTCFGLNNGTIHIGVMTGTPPYTYQWTNGASGSDLTGLAAGVYSVIVTDANGCTNLHTVTVSQPPQIAIGMTMTNAVCGLAGSATITPSGGTPPYAVLWSTGSTNFTISAFPGNYSVTVTDAAGCTATKTLTIGGTSTNLTVNVLVLSNAGCLVGGSATATATGGSGNYAYAWDNGTTANPATTLSAGPHSVTVTDITTGCSGVGTGNIPSATTLVATTVLGSNATCLVGGSATVSAVGGTLPYTYLWDNGQTTATATNLGAGPHTVIVTDASGCKATGAVTIGQSQGPTVTVTPNTSATCSAGGSATATATGGSGGYIYLWDNGQNTSTATNLTAGVHKVTVTDAAGCSTMGMVTITQVGAPTAIIAASTGAACTTGGSATAGASGGTGPYTFKWSNGAMTATVTNLGPGAYTVTVTDAAGCTATATVSIAAALPPNVVITASSNAKCDQPGSATATASGGAGTYTYKWDNGEMTMTAVNLAAGIHTVTVTDAAGCVATASVNIGFAANGIKVGDFVFYDVDQNGFQEALEAGVPNVTVMLIKAGPDGVFGTADDVILQTTTTNSNGKYEFGCVTPGTYVVMFSGIPSGYQFTAANAVNNDCLDSDANSNGKTAPFVVVAGQADNLCVDAGISTICIPVLNPGMICCNQTICEGATPALLYPSTPPVGGSGTLQYQWIQLLGPGTPQWVFITGATGETYQPGALYETAYFRRCVRRAGCFDWLESNMITITVLPAGSPGCPTFMMHIEALQQGPASVLITWETLPENDDYLYTVERSADQTVWTKLTTVMGLHNTTQNNSYSAVDESPVNGTNFYRVKRSNASGNDNYSKPVSVELKLQGEQALVIAPNPVNDKLYIKNVAQYASDVTIQLFTAQGKLLQTKVIPQGTLMQDHIEMTDMPQGIYIVRVNFGDGNNKTMKITKF